LDIGTSEGEGTASVSLSLINVPSDALCLELSVSPAAGTSGGKTQLFDITAGSSPTLSMTGLASGSANLSARSFGVPCAQVLASTSPTWVSAGPVAVSLVAGQIASTAIVLRKPSGISVTATFDDGSLSITPSTKNFGGVQVGGTSASADFSVVNPGTAAVSLTVPIITGGDSSQFQIVQNGCGTTLAAGASCTVGVLFKPLSAGSKVSSLSVGTGTASLSGTGLVGVLTISPNPATFANTAVGSSTSLTLTLTNSASQALSLGSWSISASNDFSLGATTCTTSLAASSSCTRVVTFTPASAGSKFATLTNTAGASVTLNGVAPVTGTAIRINCGSNTVVSPFAIDQYASGGTQHSVTNTINVSGVTNAAPAAVYQSERYGNTTYTLPGLTASAAYTVRLHFAELYWTAATKRVFTVAINGTNVLTNFDIYATAGAAYKAVARDFNANANASGQIAIKLTTVTDNATISGIEVLGNSCIPNCTGKCGGSDGCGGTCPNTCAAPQVCNSSTNTCACPTGQVTANQVVIMGDSFYAMSPKYIETQIESRARAAGAIGATDVYRNVAVSGQPLSYIASTEWLGIKNTSVKVVIMNGGGIDAMSSTCPTCPTTFQTLLADMATAGVGDVFYTRMPEPGNPPGSNATLKANYDVLFPNMEAVCAAATGVRCHWVDLRPVWTNGDTSDGLHPTETGGLHVGNAIWAEMAKDCIAQ
jgi:hypothetical protein